MFLFVVSFFLKTTGTITGSYSVVSFSKEKPSLFSKQNAAAPFDCHNVLADLEEEDDNENEKVIKHAGFGNHTNYFIKSANQSNYNIPGQSFKGYYLKPGNTFLSHIRVFKI